MGENGLFSKYFKGLKGKGMLLLLLAVGILLLFLGGGSEQKTVGKEEGAADVAARTEAYRVALEEELTLLCSQVEGVGRLDLLLTLEGSERAVYATDTGESGRTDYVMSGGEGLLLYREYPAVRGVAVVCEGGADPAVRAQLTALLSALLDIGTNRISIGR